MSYSFQWSLLIQIYNGKAEKGKIPNAQFEGGKDTPGSVMESSAQGDKRLKKMLMPNGVKRVMTSGQDPTGLSFQSTEIKGKFNQ